MPPPPSTRPPWLPALTPNTLPHLSLPLPTLLQQTNHTNSPLTNQLLYHYSSHASTHPSELELTFARAHIAADLAHLFRAWALTTESETTATSILTPTNPHKRPLSSSPEEPPSPPQPPGKRHHHHHHHHHNHPGLRCPYHLLGDRAHADCERKTFPNPRKLKEHIWRFTKPFRCPNCGEGFGREKTRAIHMSQRKVGCVRREERVRGYEGGREWRRDKGVERAKTEWEVVRVLQEYAGDGGGGGVKREVEGGMVTPRGSPYWEAPGRVPSIVVTGEEGVVGGSGYPGEAARMYSNGFGAFPAFEFTMRTPGEGY